MKLAGHRALIIEADPLVREMLTEVLRGDGLEVEEAATWHEAAARADVRRVDIVVADAVALEGTRSFPPTPPVILLASIGIRSRFDWAFAVLHKPFKVAELRTTVERALSAS